MEILLKMIMDKQISKIYCTYFNRLSRHPSTTQLLQFIFATFNIEIVVICDESENTETKAIQDREDFIDLLSYVTIFGNRQSAKVSSRLITKKITDECQTRGEELAKMGISIKGIVRELNNEGFYTENLKGQLAPITEHVVMKLITRPMAKLEEEEKSACSSNSSCPTTAHTFTNDTFDQFYKSNLVWTIGTKKQGKRGRPKTTGRILRKKLYQRYLEWMGEHKPTDEPLQQKLVSQLLKVRYKHQISPLKGYLAVFNISFKNNGNDGNDNDNGQTKT